MEEAVMQLAMVVIADATEVVMENVQDVAVVVILPILDGPEDALMELVTSHVLGTVLLTVVVDVLGDVERAVQDVQAVLEGAIPAVRKIVVLDVLEDVMENVQEAAEMLVDPAVLLLATQLVKPDAVVDVLELVLLLAHQQLVVL